MNWYKLKISSPIQDVVDDNYSIDTFYPNRKFDKKHIVLWFIKKDFQIHVTEDYDDHSQWNSYVENINDVIAVGKYSPKDKASSLTISYYKIPKNQILEVTKKLEQILDEAFDNPIIKTL